MDRLKDNPAQKLARIYLTLQKIVYFIRSVDLTANPDNRSQMPNLELKTTTTKQLP